MPSLNQARWEVTPPDPQIAFTLAEHLHISPITTQLLINRGIITPASAARFLYPKLSDLPDPLLLKDMEKACTRLLKAIEAKEKLLIYGDFDADGVTATALLKREFAKLGYEVEYYLPDRFNEGYDLSSVALEQIARDGYNIVITVDCGSKAVEAAQRALDLGLTLIITDHHTIGEQEPPAYAFVNPYRTDGGRPSSEIAGVGVAYQMARALRMLKKLPPDDESSLDLVALGTVADVVPIMEDNRTLVKFGLEKLRKGENIGIAALCDIARQEIAEIDTTAISYSLAPRLNAAGRLGDAKRAVELLLTNDAKTARILAVGLEDENRKRRKLGEDVLIEARNQIEDEDEPLFVLSGENWHQGVIGVAASRLCEEFHRPVFLICTGEEPARGSARAPKGIDVYDIAKSCKELMVRFGGHKQACGFSILSENIESFRDALINFTRDKYIAEDFVPRLIADEILPISQMDMNLIEEISLLAPYGLGNPEPIFFDKNILCTNSVVVGKDHLKLFMKEGQVTAGIAFHLAERIAESESRVDIAYTPRTNNYWGETNIEVQVLDFHSSHSTLQKLEVEDSRNRQYSPKDYDLILTHNGSGFKVEGDPNHSQVLYIKDPPLDSLDLSALLGNLNRLRKVVLAYDDVQVAAAENELRRHLPDDNVLRDIYLYLRDFATNHDREALARELFLSPTTLDLALSIFEELGLWHDGKPISGPKADLMESPSFRFLASRRNRALNLAKIWRGARPEEIRKLLQLYLPS